MQVRGGSIKQTSEAFAKHGFNGHQILEVADEVTHAEVLANSNFIHSWIVELDHAKIAIILRKAGEMECNLHMPFEENYLSIKPLEIPYVPENIAAPIFQSLIVPGFQYYIHNEPGVPSGFSISGDIGNQNFLPREYSSLLNLC